MPRVTVRIFGRVQGVGFRWFVVREASSLGIAGWVRNRSDGSVELRAEGVATDLRRLLQAVRRGPAGARVASVDEAWDEGAPEHRGFEVRGGV